jgi:hypothetical protein
VTLFILSATCGGQGLASPFRDGDLPFHGRFTRESSAVFSPPNTLIITGRNEGTGTRLGRFVAISEDRADTTTSTATGTFTFTAANGDQLFSTTVGVENAFVPPNVSKVTLMATIVGGTGRFADATGSFTIDITETIDFATSSATGDGSFEGRIDLNR